MKKKMEYRSGIVEAISTAFICQLFFFIVQRRGFLCEHFHFHYYINPFFRHLYDKKSNIKCTWHAVSTLYNTD